MTKSLSLLSGLCQGGPQTDKKNHHAQCPIKCGISTWCLQGTPDAKVRGVTPEWRAGEEPPKASQQMSRNLRCVRAHTHTQTRKHINTHTHRHIQPHTQARMHAYAHVPRDACTYACTSEGMHERRHARAHACLSRTIPQVPKYQSLRGHYITSSHCFW